MAVRKIRNTWWVDFGFKGRRYRFRSPVNNRPGALDYEAVLRKQIALGNGVEPHAERTVHEPRGAVLFKHWANEWSEQWISNELKHSTVVGYRQALRLYLLPVFKGHRLDDITTKAVVDLRNRMIEHDLSAKTVNNVLSILRVILNSAIDAEKLERLPRFKWLRAKKPNIDWLTATEGDALLRGVKHDHWRLLILCGLRTGMRFGELIGLRWDDIDFAQNQINVRNNIVDGIHEDPKTHEHRQIPLADDLRQALLIAPRYGDRVNMLPEGRTPHRSSAVQALDEAGRAAGLRHVHWHMLRHTFAMELRTRDVDIVTVKDLLGHKSLEMTMRYMHVNMPRMREAMVTLLQPRTPNITSVRQQSVNTDPVVA